MKIHRFYIKDTEFTGRLLLTKKDYPELHNQLVNVLHLQKFEYVEFFNGLDSINYNYEIRGIGHKEILLDLRDKKNNLIDKNLLDSNQNISVYLAAIKKDSLELALEKAVELGVSSFNILNSDRSQNKTLNLERLSKIIIEATEQSGRGQLLKINTYTSLDAATTTLKKDSGVTNYACIIPKNTDVGNVSDAKINLLKPKEGEVGDINIWIGPEGGWTEKEEEGFISLGFSVLNLGNTVLRAETATIVAIAKFI